MLFRIFHKSNRLTKVAIIIGSIVVLIGGIVIWVR